MRLLKQSGWLSVLPLVLAGCTVSVQPWSKAAALPPPPLSGLTGDPAHGSPYPPGILPTSAFRPPPVNVNNDFIVQLNKQINDLDDQKKALQDQVYSLRKQLKEREADVRQASHEMEESTRHIKRTREEFRAWQTEMEELRERIRKLEENRASLKPLIEEVLRQLERDREPDHPRMAPRNLK